MMGRRVINVCVLALLAVLQRTKASPGNGDDLAEELLGPETKGTCRSVDIPIPFAPDPVFGRCYDYRNSVCKASVCRCMKGQELSDDREYCTNPGVCSKHLAVACQQPLTGGKKYCPDWTEGAFCEEETNQCKCKADKCASVTSWNDPWPRCRKPKHQQTCNKMTGGTCALAALGHEVLDELTEGTGTALGTAGKGVSKGILKGAAHKTMDQVIEKLADKGAEMIADQAKAEAAALRDQLAKHEHESTGDGLASLAGLRTKDMASTESFGDAANCNDYRDAVCSYPILNYGLHGLSNAIDSLTDSVTGAHGAKSSYCMCRPTDCTVFSKRHSGLVCVYGPLLSKVGARMGKEFVEDFETLSDHVYKSLTQAMYGQGEDDSEAFFSPAHRHLLRSFAEHETCISGMHKGRAPTVACREYVCGFAAVAAGRFPRAWVLCGFGGRAAAILPWGFAAVAGLALVGLAWRCTRVGARPKDEGYPGSTFLAAATEEDDSA